MPVDRGDYRELNSKRNNSGGGNPTELKRDLSYFKGILSDMSGRVDRLENRDLIAMGKFKSIVVGSANISNLYIPSSTVTPRIQITKRTYGGIVGLGSGHTYSDLTGSGTYHFRLSAVDGKAYFGGGTATLDSDGITITGTGVLNITQAATTGAAGVDMSNTHTPTTGGSLYVGWRTSLTKAGTFAASGIRGISLTASNNGSGTLTNLVGALFTVKNDSSAGETTNAYGVMVDATRVAGTMPNLNGFHFSDAAVVTGNTYGARVKLTGASTGDHFGFFAENVTNGAGNYGVYIGTMGTGASDYAFYSSTGTQSLFGGIVTANLGLTYGSAQLGTPSSAPGLVLRADSSTKQRADILRTTTALLIRVRDSDNAATNPAITIADGTGDVAGNTTIHGNLTVSGTLTNSRTQSIFIPMSSFVSKVGTPNLAFQTPSGGAAIQGAHAWAFDSINQEAIGMGYLIMPDDWDGGNITPYLYWTKAAAGSGNVVWEVIYSSISSGNAIDENATNNNAVATGYAVPGTAGNLGIDQVGSAFDPGTDNDGITLNIRRTPSAANDTYTAGDVWLVGVRLDYTATE